MPHGGADSDVIPNKLWITQNRLQIVPQLSFGGMLEASLPMLIEHSEGFVPGGLSFETGKKTVIATFNNSTTRSASHYSFSRTTMTKPK